jgi:hypothetical protein
VDYSKPGSVKILMQPAGFDRPFGLGSGDDDSLRYFQRLNKAWKGMDVRQRENNEFVVFHNNVELVMQLEDANNASGVDKIYKLKLPDDIHARLVKVYFAQRVISLNPSSMTMPINVAASTSSSRRAPVAPPEELPLSELLLGQPMSPMAPVGELPSTDLELAPPGPGQYLTAPTGRQG